MVKNWNKRIVPMEVTIPELSDSVVFKGDDIMLAERDVVDTLALERARTTSNSVKYNNDQKFYNWYFREKLVWQDEQIQQDINTPEQSPAQIEEGVKPEKEKKKLFKGLFNKKGNNNLNPTDSIN